MGERERECMVSLGKERETKKKKKKRDTQNPKKR